MDLLGGYSSADDDEYGDQTGVPADAVVDAPSAGALKRGRGAREEGGEAGPPRRKQARSTGPVTPLLGVPCDVQPSTVGSDVPGASGARNCPGGRGIPSAAELLGATPATAAPSASSESCSAGGRVRSFPHVEGNYPTHLYIPVPWTAGLRRLVRQVMDGVRRQAAASSMYGGDWTALCGDGDRGSDCDNEDEEAKQEELHISLSRTVTLRKHEIRPFVDRLREKLSEVGSSRAPLRVTLKNWKLFVNDERTRSFVALLAKHGSRHVVKLIHAVDCVLRKFSLPTFYDDPQVHTTVAWALGDRTKPACDNRDGAGGDDDDDDDDDDRGKDEPMQVHKTALRHEVQVDSVYCKIGDVVYSISMASGAMNLL